MKRKLIIPIILIAVIVFVRDLGCVVDMEFGPDNALYVSSISNNGLIYKIIPK